MIKESDLRQFKNEIRISQIENRLQTDEQRLSADGRRLNNLEVRANELIEDPMINITNKKEPQTNRSKADDTQRSPTGPI